MTLSTVRSSALAALLLAASLLTVDAHPQAVAQAKRQTSTPYAGDLSIFEEPNRDQKLQIDRVMDILHITRGRAVADIGAGGGWFTVRAAKRVGPEGAVYAEDINPAAAKAIDTRAAKEKLPQVHSVLGTADDLKLPAPVDAALLLKMYHEIANPVPLMRKLRESLKPGARVGIIDRNGNGADHGLKQSVLEHEMSEAGYRRIEQYDFTKEAGEDYFLVFVVK
ncbi:MAG: class I SAM-dependent methyltransferase [Janthinobacterium lividum]